MDEIEAERDPGRHAPRRGRRSIPTACATTTCWCRRPSRRSSWSAMPRRAIDGREAWRDASSREHGAVSPRSTREGPAAADERASVRVDGEVVGVDRAGARRSCSASGRRMTRPIADALARASRSCGSSATRRAGPTARWSTSAATRWWSRSSRCSRTRAAAAGRGSRAPRHRNRRNGSTCGSRPRFASSACRSRPAVRGGDGGRARQRRTVHDLAGHRRLKR